MANAEHPNCPFCIENGKVKVLSKTTKAYLIQLVADSKVVPDRYLIIPTEHITTISGMPDDWMYHVKLLIEDLSRITGMPPEDLNLNLNVGERAGQRIKHFHFWVIFRTEPAGSGSSNLGPSALVATVNEQCVQLEKNADLVTESPLYNPDAPETDGAWGPYVRYR